MKKNSYIKVRIKVKKMRKNNYGTHLKETRNNRSDYEVS